MRMGKVPFMDTTGESNLAELVRHLQAVGGKLMISGIQPQPLELLKRTGLYSTIGEAQFYPRTGEAINDALNSIDYSKCIGCSHAAFRECTAFSNLEEAGSMRGLKGRKNPVIAPELNSGL